MIIRYSNEKLCQWSDVAPKNRNSSLNLNNITSVADLAASQWQRKMRFELWPSRFPFVWLMSSFLFFIFFPHPAIFMPFFTGNRSRCRVLWRPHFVYGLSVSVSILLEFLNRSFQIILLSFFVSMFFVLYASLLIALGCLSMIRFNSSTFYWISILE